MAGILSQDEVSDLLLSDLSLISVNRDNLIDELLSLLIDMLSACESAHDFPEAESVVTIVVVELELNIDGSAAQVIVWVDIVDELVLRNSVVPPLIVSNDIKLIKERDYVVDDLLT